MEKYYCLYEIKVENSESSLNGSYYYGKHITSNLNDDYYGNGTILNNYKNKYGIKGLIKTILKLCTSEEELNKEEYLLIKQKQEQLKEKCLNLNDGGAGSFTYINKTLSTEQRHKNAVIGGLKNKERLENPETAKEWREKVKQMHLNMSEEDKKQRYSKVSNSLKEYYKTEKGQEELEERKIKNKETNKRVSSEWRTEFKILFRGYQPEAFRKYKKQKEANQLYKQIKNLSPEKQTQKVNDFFELLNL